MALDESTERSRIAESAAGSVMIHMSLALNQWPLWFGARAKRYHLLTAAQYSFVYWNCKRVPTKALMDELSTYHQTLSQCTEANAVAGTHVHCPMPPPGLAQGPPGPMDDLLRAQ